MKISTDTERVLKAREVELRNITAGQLLPSRSVEVPQGETGVVLADLNLKPIYTNNAAVYVLNYPDQSCATTDGVQRRIRFILRTESITTPSSPADFLSGRRQYVCRPFLLEPRHSEARPSVVSLVLERRPRDPVELSEISRRFHFSPRERETVQCLICGLTTKEIAKHMNVSPNTVKQFIRLIMSKMGVSTRSGIVGKLMSG